MISLARYLEVDHFAEGESPDPPFICYLLPGSDNFSADGRVYFRISEVRIELYTDRKDPGAEVLVETVLDDAGIFYNKSEVWNLALIPESFRTDVRHIRHTGGF